jgi:hypothetical protein
MFEQDDLNIAVQDNEPSEIQRPAQFPTATKIDNGIAYDISGKALGPVGDQGTSQAAQPKDDDFFAKLGGKAVIAQQEVKDDAFFEKLGGKPVQTPQVQQAGALPAYSQITGIGPRPIGERHPIDKALGLPSPTEVGNWLDDVKGDVLNGTHATWVGSLLSRMGAKGTRYGVSEGAAQASVVGAIPEGLVEAAHGVTQLGEHPVRAANEIVGGAGKVLGPLAVTQPEALPFILHASVGSKIASAVATQMGADDETAEVIGNVAGIATGGKTISKTQIDVSFERSLTASIKPRTVSPAKLTFLQRVWNLMRGTA